MLLALSVAAALAGAPQDPVVADRGRGWTLQAYQRPAGGLCVKYAARGTVSNRPKKVRTFRTRLCGSIDSKIVRFETSLAGCTSAPPALFGFAGPDVDQVNVRVGDGPVLKTKLRRIPKSVGIAGSTFVLRRALDGRSGTVTGHFADGEQFSHRFGPYPIAGCTGPSPVPVPAG